MRIRDFVCRTAGCPESQAVATWDPEPDAPICRGCMEPMRSRIYAPSVVFTGAITARYNNQTAENPHQDGHIAWERDPVTRKCHPVEIKTFDDQRAYCARNHLANPKEFGNNYSVAADGRKVENSVGMPGCEV
jgi:hypothetical protein